jgi:cell division septation protein DedD
MSDEGFHEIQLNGKQLVFLFMAATVVSVVIFLCGVMVGRGVRAQGAAAGASDFGPSAAVEEPARTEPAPAPAGDRTPPAAAAPATTPPEPAEGDGGRYFEDLTRAEGKPEAVAPPVGRRAESAPPKPVPPAETPAPAPAAERPSAVTSGGYAVQIAALRDRSEADAIVKRLAGKGYQAFVVNPVPGKPPVYRVQVGRFADRGEAEKIAARLKSEEQFSPWVTR